MFQRNYWQFSGTDNASSQAGATPPAQTANMVWLREPDLTQFVYSTFHGRWIGPRETIQFGAKSSHNALLSFRNNEYGSSVRGYEPDEAKLIVGISLAGEGSPNKQFTLLHNGNPLQLFTLSAGRFLSTNLAFEIAYGDVIQIRSEATNSPITDVVGALLVRPIV